MTVLECRMVRLAVVLALFALFGCDKAPKEAPAPTTEEAPAPKAAAVKKPEVKRTPAVANAAVKLRVLGMT